MARKIINISVPESMHFFVDYRVKTGGYASISEYFRDLLRNDERLEHFRWKEVERPGTGTSREPRSEGRTY